ncbi:MAG: PilZ domain-containing protein [Deltaproteobacteria bacterium]|nr:PilZ domain-containing protein [Deltaproteobacteria bacterium]
MTRDRREMPRREIALKIEPQDGGGLMIAQDLGLGGMLVTTKDARWPGQLLRVRFRLPGERRAIRATCQVMGLADVPRGIGLALRFVRLHPDAKAAIHRFIDHRPLEAPADDSAAARVVAWIRRIVDDCAELRAFARP